MMPSADPRADCVGAVAILDDAPSWRPIARYLDAAAYDVRLAQDEAELDRLLGSERVDAVLMDVRPPQGDRFLYCQQLSRQYSASILVVGSSHDVTDKVVALELGADDYIEAPCNPRELVARLKSITRGRAAHRRRPAHLQRIYRFGGWSLDLFSQEVTTPQGRAVPLSPSEFSLMRAFVTTSQRIVSRAELMAAIEIDPADVKARAIDVLMSRLRRKLSESGGVLFRTIRNQGYVMMVEVDRSG